MHRNDSLVYRNDSLVYRAPIFVIPRTMRFAARVKIPRNLCTSRNEPGDCETIEKNAVLRWEGGPNSTARLVEAGRCILPAAVRVVSCAFIPHAPIGH